MPSWKNAYTSTDKEILCALDLDFTHDALIVELSKKYKENLRLITRVEIYKQLVKEGSQARTDLNELEKKLKKKQKKLKNKFLDRQKIFEDALNWQRKQAEKLATQIEEDVENTCYDSYKKEKYKKQANDLKEDENFTLTTDHAYKALSWFTSIRLFFCRVNRVVSPFVKFLGKWFDFLGLSYGFELIVDLGEIIWSTLKPLREPEKKLEAEGVSLTTICWWRFKNVMLEDDRIPRMLNAAFWLSVNLSCIILTGGFSLLFHPIVAPALAKLIPSFNFTLAKSFNLGGFTFDIFNELYRGIKDYFQSKKTLEIVEKKVEKLKERKNQWREENKDKKEIEELDLKIQSRELIQTQLKERINSNVIPSRLYQIGVAITIVIGMGLVFFPPTFMVGAGFLIGGVTALLAGSVFGGFGKRLWNKMWDSLNSKNNKMHSTTEITTKETTPSLQPVPAVSLENENLLETSTTAQVISSFSQVTSSPQSLSVVPSEIKPEIKTFFEENPDKKKSSKPIPIPSFKHTSDNLPSSANHPFFSHLASPTNIGIHRSSGERAPHTQLLIERESPECIMVCE